MAGSSGNGPSNAMVTDSNEAVEFKLIRNVNDITEDTCSFKPVMSHQIFGAQEIIYGYKNLKIQLYFSAAHLVPYLGISYTEKVDPKKHESVEADNIASILREKLEIEFISNLDDFIMKLDKEHSLKPLGDLISSFSSEINDENVLKQSSFEIYFSEISTPGLIEYHKMLQTFILWFIDAASFIDTDDERWKFFLVYERFKNDGRNQYAIAGFATVYEYYSYPNNIRPRLSQMLVLPPFQRRGLGAELLSAIYSHYKQNHSVTDITVEDPSEDLQLVRDFVDAKNCLKLSSFQPSELWSKGFNDEMVKEASEKLKVNRKQARRVYEILKLKTVNKENEEEYKKYRLEIKKRLNLPNHNELMKLQKLGKCMKPQEVAELKASFILNDEQRIANLEKTYKELEELYERVISRLDNS